MSLSSKIMVIKWQPLSMEKWKKGLIPKSHATNMIRTKGTSTMKQIIFTIAILAAVQRLAFADWGTGWEMPRVMRSVPSEASRWFLGGRDWTRQSLEDHLVKTHGYPVSELRRLSYSQLSWLHNEDHDRHGNDTTKFGRILSTSRVTQKSEPECPT